MSISNTAMAFFDACETGRGWDGCKQFCTADASFAAQSEPVAEIKTLSGYCDWMKGLLVILPDGRYEVKAHGPREMPIWGADFMVDANALAATADSPFDSEAYVKYRIYALVEYVYRLQVK